MLGAGKGPAHAVLTARCVREEEYEVVRSARESMCVIEWDASRVCQVCCKHALLANLAATRPNLP